MTRPGARAKGTKPARVTPEHEVGHLVTQTTPGTWVSTFVYHYGGKMQTITSGPVSRRAFNMHYMRHRDWVDAFHVAGKIPQEAVEWSG